MSTRQDSGTQATAAAAESGDVAAAVTPTPRTCGACTACCQGWLTANVLGQELAPGKPCRFSGAGGCSIYEDRPKDPCQGFICGWLLKGSPFPESFRPDRLGVIIMAKPWRNRFAYVLVPAERAPDAKLLEWMRQYSTKTGIPFLFDVDTRPRGYGSPEFQQDMIDQAARGEPLLPGLNPRPGGPCKLVPLELKT